MGWSELEAFRPGKRIVNMVVETPRGSRAKYKFEPKSGVFELHKSLALGFSFPFPFGYVPRTEGEDGDPLDVLLLTTLEPLIGAVVPARLIGVLEIEQRDPGQQSIRNDRLIAVPDVDHEDRPIADLSDLPASELGDIETFFVESGARDGNQVVIVARRGAEDAIALVKRQSSRFTG